MTSAMGTMLPCNTRSSVVRIRVPSTINTKSWGKQRKASVRRIKPASSSPPK